jgi:hypothetical protein
MATQRRSGFHSPSTDGPLPLISGFVALIKVFLCVVDVLSHGFPGSPPQAYAMTSGGPRPLIYPENPLDGTHPPERSAPSKSSISLSALLSIIRNLQTTLEELPNELKISSLDTELQSPNQYSYMSPKVTHQFDIMRANIHITSLYIQSTILEACSTAFANPQANAFDTSPGDETRSSPSSVSRTQLWLFRKSIARELLEVLNFCSTRTLEANGSSIVSTPRFLVEYLAELTVVTDREDPRNRRHTTRQ